MIGMPLSRREKPGTLHVVHTNQEQFSKFDVNSSFGVSIIQMQCGRLKFCVKPKK